MKPQRVCGSGKGLYMGALGLLLKRDVIRIKWGFEATKPCTLTAAYHGYGHGVCSRPFYVGW